MLNEVWDEITYPFPKFNGATQLVKGDPDGQFAPPQMLMCKLDVKGLAATIWKKRYDDVFKK